MFMPTINQRGLLEILDQLLVHHPPRNDNLECGMTRKGLHKCFSTSAELAEYIFHLYGSEWKSHVKVISNSPERTAKKKRLEKSVHLDRQFISLGTVLIGRQCYIVYSQPSDNLCFFHSFSRMLYPFL